jgi:tRNA (cmo5U34)-methyltransferase
MSQSERRFSNKAGEEYDLFSICLPHQEEIQKQTVLTLVNHFKKDIPKIDVLEIGFGTGITSKELLASDTRVHLIGVDNEPAMLKRGLDKLIEIPNERFKLEIIDALEYLKTQPDNSFDAVVSVWVLHNLHKQIRRNILEEIYRVLKSGGIFVNGDKIAVTDNTLHKEHLEWQFQQFNVYNEIDRTDLKKEWTEHYIEDENPDRILYEDVFLKDLQEIGFKQPSISNRHYLDAISSAIKL